MLIPDTYRNQYARRGWTLKRPPDGYVSVTLPTPLGQATRVRNQPEEAPVVGDGAGVKAGASNGTPKKKRVTRRARKKSEA